MPKKQLKLGKFNMVEFEQYKSAEEIKQLVWEQKLKELEEVTDSLGEPIEKGTIETVAALNLLGIPTSQSCEGHTKDGLAAPWVMIAPPGEPIRKVDQEKINQLISQKYGLDNLKVASGQEPTQAHQDAWKEQVEELAQQPDTEEFKQWQKGIDDYRKKLQQLIDGFYRRNTKPQDNGGLALETGADYIKIHNGGQDYEKSNKDKLTDQDRIGLPGRLNHYQEEMKRFSEFLKQKYFNSWFKERVKEHLRRKRQKQ